jgi:transposase
LDILQAYRQLGSYRAAAQLCGTTHKTVRRVVARGANGPGERPARPHNTDTVKSLIAERIQETDGRISAKRLLPTAQAAGYTGSARNFRRAVALAKGEWRRQRRSYRPWVPVPGEHLVIDWGTINGLQVFCAVLAWSRYRFVRFATNQRRETTLQLLTECFEELGGVPAVVLADRMGCLKAGVVANVVVPHPDYVRFAAHYRFRPDFCEAADPESKGVVEHLVGYSKSDLVVPSGGWATIAAANAAARAWCAEVNTRVHSEIAAVPAERLVVERSQLHQLPSLRPPLRAGELRTVDRLSLVRFGSARYSVPEVLRGRKVSVSVQDDVVVVCHGEAEVARHAVVAPGEVSVCDEHYGGPARRPVRAIRPRTPAEIAFVGLGPTAEQFLRLAAAAGTTKLSSELANILTLERAWGRPALLAALERAITFRRFKASDLRSILLAGAGVAIPCPAGEPLSLDLPAVPERPLSDYAVAVLA